MRFGRSVRIEPRRHDEYGGGYETLRRLILTQRRKGAKIGKRPQIVLFAALRLCVKLMRHTSVSERSLTYATAAVVAPAASASSAARWVLSQVNSFSSRPKCPPAAVLR